MGSEKSAFRYYRAGLVCQFLAVGLLLCDANRVWAVAERSLAWSHVSSTVERYFARQRGRQAGDLISRADVAEILGQLEQLGWRVSDRAKMLSDTLSSGHFLLGVVKSREGREFMRRTSGYELIYDRLDRISQEQGGQRLIRDLIKLPDGARYAKLAPPRGVPGMDEFLPKSRSGKSRKVEDYRQPTGRIYTRDQLLKRLAQSHARDSRRAR